MLQNHLKLAIRRLLKSKTYSMINILGLAVGMAAFFVIVQYVSFELSFDRFHTNHDTLYRVGLKRYVNGELQHESSKTFVGIRRLLKENFPEVGAATGFYETPANTGFLFRYGGKIFNEAGGVLNPDSAFFSVFPSLLVKGDPETALQEPHNLIISEAMAKKIFGDKDPMGQTIERIDDYESGGGFLVTGIMKDIPENSHFHAAFLRHIEDSWPDQEDWKGQLHTYITLAPGTKSDDVTRRINTLLRNKEKANPAIEGTEVFLQPMTAIHLSSHFQDELEANGNIPLVICLACIGLGIFVMAWINYINLETARFISRAKEVGVRRIIGSGKRSLMFQFLIEYFCLLFCAAVVATLFLYLLYPYLANLTGIVLNNARWFTTEVWTMGIGVLMLGSLLAGIYPALFLWKLNPVATLKGKFGKRTRGATMRSSLVTFQFTISIILIALVLVIGDQLDFMRMTNTKIQLDQVIALRNPTAYSNQELQSKHSDYKVFENRLLQNSGVKMVTSSSAIPGREIGFSYVNLIKRDLNAPYDPTVYKTLFVDYNFIPSYELNVIAGRNFPPPASDRPVTEPWQDESWTTIVLNERAIKALGFLSAEAAVDQTVHFQLFDDFLEYRIIGVVEDYHHEAIKKEVFPTILALNYSAFQQVYYSVSLEAGADLQAALADIERTWKEVFPEKPFEYFFLDEYYDQQFRSELQFAGIFSLFSGIAIFIAALGILGMTLLESNSRIKEISIRKVLGASLSSLLSLLSRAHIRVVLLSALISIPLVYFIATEWLSNYPARIEVGFGFILIPILIISGMVALTASFYTWKAADANPVDHLKHE